ncbi:hypothetical protein P171DRAFT_440714 [Karstenula rhodostoma CBS 690.94]|uniref:Uncharacterized protein n=1 Tax=Karstenula rhodostoma CBS 690.94 TaxID=1392251 RepID=A0A9P4PNE4_9PLEO|nr:hypothetical protein P171DRAFT_440714 [Karstenula rhodostoma CBS 690.94]
MRPSGDRTMVLHLCCSLAGWCRRYGSAPTRSSPRYFSHQWPSAFTHWNCSIWRFYTSTVRKCTWPGSTHRDTATTVSVGTCEKKRLAYKQQKDRNDAVRQRKKSLDSQKIYLQTEAESGKIELERANATWKERVRELEAIKAFYEERFGSYNELVKAQQEDAEGMINMNEVQDELGVSFQVAASPGSDFPGYVDDHEFDQYNEGVEPNEQGNDGQEYDSLDPGLEEQDFDQQDLDEEDIDQFDDDEDTSSLPAANTGRPL